MVIESSVAGGPSRARLSRIRSMRGGSLNDPRFESRRRGEGIFADQISRPFRIGFRRAGVGELPKLSTAAFRSDGCAQPVLFDRLH